VANYKQSSILFKPEHPAYFPALSNLRATEHRPGTWQQTADEVETVWRIDAAHAEKKAAIEDGKNLQKHPAVEEREEHEVRLRVAPGFLRKAREMVNKEEYNAFAPGLKTRSSEHIEEAIRTIEKAIHQ